MSRDIYIYLDDITNALEKIRSYTADMELKEFLKDEKTQDAVIRKLIVIGEAAKNIPEEIKEKNIQIVWYQIVALRNIMIHEYFRIRIETIWDIIKIDLPKFEIQLKSINL
jgi:uncharacterized protein with HEPN domain